MCQEEFRDCGGILKDSFGPNISPLFEFREFQSYCTAIVVLLPLIFVLWRGALFW